MGLCAQIKGIILTNLGFVYERKYIKITLIVACCVFNIWVKDTRSQDYGISNKIYNTSPIQHQNNRARGALLLLLPADNNELNVGQIHSSKSHVLMLFASPGIMEVRSQPVLHYPHHRFFEPLLTFTLLHFTRVIIELTPPSPGGPAGPSGPGSPGWPSLPFGP